MLWNSRILKMTERSELHKYSIFNNFLVFLTRYVLHLILDGKKSGQSCGQEVGHNSI